MWKRATITVLFSCSMIIPWTGDAAQWRYTEGGDPITTTAVPPIATQDAPTGTRTPDSKAAMPRNNMSMSAVRDKFGKPQDEVPAVGEPPISRWRYSAYTVYFERDRVIVAVSNEIGPTP